MDVPTERRGRKQRLCSYVQRLASRALVARSVLRSLFSVLRGAKRPSPAPPARPMDVPTERRGRKQRLCSYVQWLASRALVARSVLRGRGRFHWRLCGRLPRYHRDAPAGDSGDAGDTGAPLRATEKPRGVGGGCAACTEASPVARLRAVCFLFTVLCSLKERGGFGRPFLLFPFDGARGLGGDV